MAKCYGDLVMELWSGTQKSVAPLKLRVSSSHPFLPESIFCVCVWMHELRFSDSLLSSGR